MNLEIVILWALRIGLFLLLLGLLLPDKNKKTLLSKTLHKKPVIFHKSQKNKIFNYLEEIADNNFFRHFMLKEDSDQYVKLEQMIVRSGGLRGLTPNVVQLAKITLPFIVFVVLLASYLFRKIAQTVELNVSHTKEIVEQTDLFQSFVPHTATTQSGSTISGSAMLCIFLISLLLYFVPEMIIKWRIKAKENRLKKELPIVETFVVVMLETGVYTAYNILEVLMDTTEFLRPYISVCLNEYHINPKRAIQNMADKIDNEEFQVICNGLKQAVEVDKKYTAMFVQQHIEQIKRLEQLSREASIKKKPMIYVLLLALPLASIVIIWFYPWFVNAMKMLTSVGGGGLI
ncbi:MAG: hypothetical protein PHN69_05925 [Candidatus Pacebacteria bacterium]|nr:hypothetical protein [Candidatus Paceibacterota bacterium]